MWQSIRATTEPQTLSKQHREPDFQEICFIPSSNSHHPKGLFKIYFTVELCLFLNAVKWDGNCICQYFQRAVYFCDCCFAHIWRCFIRRYLLCDRRTKFQYRSAPLKISSIVFGFLTRNQQYSSFLLVRICSTIHFHSRLNLVKLWVSQFKSKSKLLSMQLITAINHFTKCLSYSFCHYW